MIKLDKKNIENILALTPTQEGMLFHYLENPAGPRYHEQLCLELSGQIDIECFEQAWNTVVKTNEMLRTVFRWEKLEKPAQIILRKRACDLCFYDLTGKINSRQEAVLEEVKANDAGNTFDLRHAPFRVILCKIAGNKYRLIISNHHILYDGWSTGIILREFFEVYHALSKGKQPVTPPEKPSFEEFIQWLRNQDKTKQKQFWSRYLAGVESPGRLPVKIRKKAGEPTGAANHSLTLKASIKNQLERFLKEHRLTLASFLYSTWGILLQRYCNSEEVIFGTTVSGRSAPIKGLRDMVGLCINTVPLRIKTGSGEKVKDLLSRVNHSLRVREQYETTPLVDIKEYSQWENNVDLFDSLIVMENYPLEQNLMRKNSRLPLMVESYSIVESTNYDLSISITVGQVIGINFIYNPASLEESIISRISSHFNRIIEKVLKDSMNDISGIEILSEEEKKQVLYDFNATAAAYPQDKTIQQLFSEQAEQTPDHTALVGVHETYEKHEKNYNMSNLSHMSYKELNEKSHRLARRLKEKGIEADNIVGLMAKRSIEMVVGILGILIAGGAYLPIDPDYPEERVQYVLKDSDVKILVTVPDLSEKFSIANCQLLMVNEKLPNSRRLNNPPREVNNNLQLKGNNLAYIIYTSGSTGQPKGVMVEHFSAVNLLSALQNKYPFRETDVYLLKTSYFFDVSVCELFGWFLGGGRLAILERNGERDPKKILDTIEKARVTHINFVPSMFKVFTEALNPENIENLSTLRYIFLAGETLLPQLISRFRQLNAVIALENIYGPTEATVYASWYSFSLWLENNIIPIGKPLPNVQLFILDCNLNLQPVGITGELFIAGHGLARGYLNNPELTGDRFCLRRPGALFEKTAPGPRKNFLLNETDKNYLPVQSCNHASMQLSTYHSTHYPIYHTGDLGRWLPEGNIEFLGRIDNQVKIRGFRIELEEIELALMEHPGIKMSAVMAKQPRIGPPAGERDEPYLCAYVVPHPDEACSSSLDSSHLRRYLSGKLPGYMVPAYFVILEHLPLTTNGKLDRKVLPGPEINLMHPYSPPGNKREERLEEIYSQILEIEKEKIGIDANFFELGGHSLKATRLINRIHKEFGIRLNLAECLKNPTIRQISRRLWLSAGDNGIAPIQPVEEKEYYPLSSGQERLYTLQQMDRKNVAYNTCCSRVLVGKIKKQKIEWAFGQLIHRHESLRTSFEIIGGQIVQRIHPEVTFAFEHFTLPIKHFIRPFDLSQAPLLRVGWVTHENNELTLLIDLHHIITDGVSQAVLMKELLGLCRGETLPSHRLRYKDFSHWQQQWKTGEFKRQEAFWLREFQDKIPRSNMPTDFPRPEVQCFAGDMLIFELNKNETDELKRIAREQSVTSFMMLLAVYYVFLSAVSHQEDIVVGVPTDGRRYDDLDNIIGMFVNTLPLRNFPGREITFRTLLKNVKTKTLQAFENQDYQFADLVERLLSTRDARRNPIFDVMFTFNNREDETDDLNLENILNKTARFDLILHTFEKNQTFYFAFEYSTRLYKKETIERFAVYFKKILSAVMDNPDKHISGIEIISDEEKNRFIRAIKNKDEKSTILMEHARRNEAKGQKPATTLTADFNF